MDRNKAKSYLGLANKAGYLVIGGDSLERHTKKLYLILVDTTAAKSTQKIVARFENIRQVQVDDLAELVSIANCKVVGVRNKNLSENILKNLIDKID